MKKIGVTLIAALIFSSCSAKNEAKAPDQASNPNPSCGATGKAGAIQALCLPKLPPLSEPQKKEVFAVLSSEELNKDTVSLFLSGGTSDKPEINGLLKSLQEGSCLKENSQSSDGHSLGRVFGETCPILSQTSFINASTPTGSKEEKNFETRSYNEAYVAMGRLRNFSSHDNSDAEVTEIASKQYHIVMINRTSGALTAFDWSLMSFEGGGGGTGDFDISSDNEIKIRALDIYSDMMMRFEGFSAILHVALKSKDDGTSSLEVLLNGEPVPLGARMEASLHTRLEHDVLRRALSGI